MHRMRIQSLVGELKSYMPLNNKNWKCLRTNLQRQFFFLSLLLQLLLISFSLISKKLTLQQGVHSEPKPATFRYCFGPSSLPIPSLWVVPVHQPQASSIVYRTWTVDSFHIWYYTCFNAIFPNHSTLSLSHRVQKTVLHISVSSAVSYAGLLLPSF